MVVADTSVWSLFLRRRRAPALPSLARFKEHLAADNIVLLGIVHQEILSGIKNAAQFKKVDSTLSEFEEICATPDDHRRAAEFYNTCRARGIQGAAIDFLICAMAARRDLPILTTDTDFLRYAKLLPIALDAHCGI